MRIKLVLVLLLVGGKLIAQSPAKQAEIAIKTSAQCEMCKERIEKAMAFEKGVKKAELNLETKVVTIIYRTGKTEPAKLRKTISKTGYDADDIKADQDAYNMLPACCKKPGDQ